MATLEQIDNRKRVLKFIETFPEYHDQNSYFCGTTACIGGTAIMFDRLTNSGNLISVFEEGKATEEQFRDDYEDGFWEQGLASELLGLDEEESSRLFYCWSNEDAVAYLRELASEQPDA